jgi:hypothetical protein
MKRIEQAVDLFANRLVKVSPGNGNPSAELTARAEKGEDAARALLVKLSNSDTELDAVAFDAAVYTLLQMINVLERGDGSSFLKASAQLRWRMWTAATAGKSGNQTASAA